MAKQYIYAPINPIWMNPVTTFNPEFNTLPFDFQQPTQTYSQKIKRGLPCNLQALSDWVPTLKIFDGIQGFLIDTIAASTPTNGITGQTFTVYEFGIVWGNYPEGFYYIEISYTDDSSVKHIERSGILQTADKWPGTLVFQYTNSYNNFSAIFSTGIVFCFVCEGNIADFAPAFDDIIYNDQEYNVTKLNAIPRREFTLYVGSARGFAGVPPWVGDRMNWIMACDQIQIDGIFYQNISGSKWEIARADQTGQNNFIGLKITIIEVINLFLQQYQPGQNPAGSIQVITRDLKFLANSANITIPGIFTANSVLRYIIIFNLGGDLFTIKASTAADGSVPITADFVTTGIPKEFWYINEPFNAVSTLYLLGLAGTNCNIWLVYDQMDAPFIAPITSTKKFAKGTLYMYEEVTVGDFETHWNVGDGTGNTGTDYEGCVLSGTNGTKDRNELLPIGWNSLFPLTRDTLTGNSGNEVALSSGNLPSFNLNVGLDLKGGGNGVLVVSSQNPGPGGHGSLDIPFVGTANPVDISNAARITVFFVCITE